MNAIHEILRQIGMIANIHDHVNALKNPLISGISWIAFIVKYFVEKSAIQRKWPECVAAHFHLILNLNLRPDANIP